jgi:rhodanese-related sulfurtransferase
MNRAMQRVAEAKSKITEVSITDLTGGNLDNHTIVDVREQHEHDAGNIDNSIHVPRGLIEFEIMKHCKNLGTDEKLVLYCKTGGRSALATESLQELGYSNVVSLAGGYEAWHKHHNQEGN